MGVVNYLSNYLITYTGLYCFAALFATASIALYGLVVKPNLIKKIIALTILGDTFNIAIILLGYRVIQFPKPPVLPTLHPTIDALRRFLNYAVDPLPQALVITAIVINLAVVSFLTVLAIQAYRLKHTLNLNELFRGGDDG